jgi:predicted dehydrogenase
MMNTNSESASPENKRPRLAVVGTSHWHHKFYREIIAQDSQVVAFSDPNPEKIKEVEPFYGNIGRLDWRELLDERLKLDGVIVLAPHDEMKEVCLAFIERRIPIFIEKPGGMNAAEVGAIREAAERLNVPIAVPFIQRLGNLWKYLQQVGTLDYATFLFQSGPPERYINQSPWALERVHAGGGCFINLAVHYIDLFLIATRASKVTVQAQAQYRLSRAYDVEDRLTALITTDDGVSAVVECGYAFPGTPPGGGSNPLGRYLAYSARGSEGFLAMDGNGDIALTPKVGDKFVVNDNVDSGPLSKIFIRDAIAGISTGFAGLPGIGDLHRTMQVVDAAYDSAYNKRAVTATIVW